MKNKIVFIVLSFFTFTSLVFADIRDGSILFLQPSVRAASMQNAYTSNMIEDVFGIMSNPAYRASLPMMGIMYNTVFYEEKDLSDGAFGAFSFIYPEVFYGINIGAGAVSTMVGNIDIEQDVAAYLNLSKKIKFLSFGANLKYLYSKIYQDRNSDYITGDLGLIANYSFISVGVSGFNLFGDFYDFEGKKIDPYFTAGITADLNYKKLFVTLALDAIYSDLSQKRAIPRAGFEIAYSFFSLRLGYEYDDYAVIKDKYSAGLGFDYRNLKIDYAYIYDNERYDRHMMALSYKLKMYMVKNEQFKRQVKYEKQQQKLKKKAAKQEIKEKKEFEKKKKKLQALRTKREKEESKAKSKELPLQSVKRSSSNEEYATLLSHDGVENQEKPIEDSLSDEKPIYSSVKTNQNEFDAAKYLLELESESSKSEKSKKKKEYIFEAKEYIEQPTPYSEDDYDPAKELLGRSDGTPDFRIVRDDKPKKVKKDKTVKKQKKIKEKSAKKSKKDNYKDDYRDEFDEFDAARYILANPGAHKIKQYYVQPTKHSKDDYDPALLLISQ